MKRKMQLQMGGAGQSAWGRALESAGQGAAARAVERLRAGVRERAGEMPRAAARAKSRAATRENGPVVEKPRVGAPGAAMVVIAVHRELARKIFLLCKKNKLKIKFDGSLNLWLFFPRIQCPMPNSHSPDKEPLSLQIPRTLMARLKRRAKKEGVTFPNLVTTILTSQTHEIVLTSKDYEAIARATKKAEATGKRCATVFNDPA